jgi:hypothetical protein
MHDSFSIIGWADGVFAIHVMAGQTTTSGAGSL